jgi:hypothetical protein
MAAIASLKPIISTKPAIQSSKTTKQNPFTKYKSNKYLISAERVNGRAAMIGFVSAMAEEVVNQHTLFGQLQEHVGLVTAVVGLVVVGTASNPKDEGLLWGVFNREAETINGRAAMVGILSLALTEAVNGAYF